MSIDFDSMTLDQRLDAEAHHIAAAFVAAHQRAPKEFELPRWLWENRAAVIPKWSVFLSRVSGGRVWPGAPDISRFRKFRGLLERYYVKQIENQIEIELLKIQPSAS